MFLRKECNISFLERKSSPENRTVGTNSNVILFKIRKIHIFKSISDYVVTEYNGHYQYLHALESWRIVSTKNIRCFHDIYQ